MSTLILTLPHLGIDPATRLEYVLSGDDQSVLGHDTVALDLLPKNCDEVVALVPAQRLSWHLVQLPTGSLPRGMSGERSSQRLQAILEGLLEDDLLDEPAQLHLALQPDAGTDHAVWVAACDRSWLSAALHVLAAAGLPVRRIVPEYNPQMLADTVYVTGEVDSPRVAGLAPYDRVTKAQPAGDVLVCALNAVALERLVGKAGESAGAELLAVVAEPSVVALAERVFNRSVSLQQRVQRLLAATQTNWNLAQFELANIGRDRRWAGRRLALKSFLRAPQWRAARWAVSACVLINLIGLNALALREQARLTDKRQAVRAVLTDTFPRVPVVVDAPLQMARELAALQRSSGQSAPTDMEHQLAVLAAAVADNESLTAIDYEATQLRVKGLAVADAQAMKARLQAAGLNATQQGDQWLISAGAKP